MSALSRAVGLVRACAAVSLLMATLPALAQPVRATALLGAVVDDAHGESLGYVSDLAINLATRRVRYAMVHVTTPDGTGDKVYGVPLDGLRPSPQRGHLVLGEQAELPPAPGNVRMARATQLLGRKVWDLLIELDTGEVLRAIVRTHDGQERQVPLEAAL